MIQPIVASGIMVGEVVNLAGLAPSLEGGEIAVGVIGVARLELVGDRRVHQWRVGFGGRTGRDPEGGAGQAPQFIDPIGVVEGCWSWASIWAA